jgi:cell wall-associated NlpC family hydrolase
VALRFLLILVALLASACATAPPESPSVSRAADLADTMVGTPYRFGGASPSTGFDCSGLVHFSFMRAGLGVPRSTEEQRRASRAIGLSELQRGDLLFFYENRVKDAHVGIYLGGGRFVHAPSSGKSVRRDSLDSPYWRRNLSGARRLNI